MRVGQQHYQTVNPQTLSTRGRQSVSHGAQIVFIHLMGFVVTTGAQGKLRIEAAALLHGVIQFRESVADFHARDEDLEAFHKGRVVRLVFRQG